MTPDARARVLRAPRPERPRQQRGPHSTGASSGSRQQTRGSSTSRGQGLAAEDPSTEPYTPMPPMFSHVSSSQFQSPMAPPTKGFFVGALQPYSSMMTAPLHSPTLVVPVSVYPLQFSDFGGSSYGMVQQTPPGSLFATRPSGSSHHAANDEDAYETEDDDDAALVRRNLPRNRHAPCCGTRGHRGH
ncbi:hypothetical protein V6N13_130112 [Hibiscus sabdariffa]